MNPYIGANTWIWTSPLTDDTLASLARKVSVMGFDLIELPVEHPSDWDAERASEVLADSDLEATVCAVMSPGRELAGSDKETIEETLEYVRRCIAAAGLVGGEKVEGGVVAGPLYSSVGRTWKMDADERRRFLADLSGSLTILSDYAGERGVRLAVEPLNRFETSVFNTVEQTLELVEAVDSPSCGLLLDTFHMNIEERDISRAIRSAGERLVHFHACSNDRGAPGENDNIDWSSVSHVLSEIEYDGAVSIESFASGNEAIATATAVWRPLAPSQDELAADGLAFLRDALNGRKRL